MVRFKLDLVLAFVLLAACSAGEGEWGGRVVEREGVVRVENPDRPLAAPGEVTAELAWVQTGPEAGDIWEVPRKIHVFRESIFLVDRQASQIHRLTLSGDLKPSFGSPGGGPGQYGFITDAIPTQAGLFVVDMGNARVEVLSNEGNLLASHPLSQIVYTASSLGPEAVALFGITESEPGWTRFEVDGERNPFDFPDFPHPPGAEGPITRGSAWGDRLVRLRHTSPQVRIYSRDGRLVRVIDLPLPPEDATDEEVEGIVQEVSSFLADDGVPAGVIQQQVDAIRARPREKLKFRKVEFDDGSGLAAIWEQNPEDFGSGNATLHLLTIDGIYLASLEFDRPWGDFDLYGGVLYSLSRDPDTDLATLLAHKLDVPEELMSRARTFFQQGAPPTGPPTP